MAAWLDGVLFTPTLGGTTDWVVSAAVIGYNTPALAGAAAIKYKYHAQSADQSQWEDGEGTYVIGSTTLPRTTVLYNSAGTGTGPGQSGAGTKINFTTVPTVSIVALKEDMISIEEANSFTAAQQEQARANIGCSVGIPDVIVEEQQTSGTNAGTFTLGSFVTRALNTLVRNFGSIASLASNQVTLAAGTYFFKWSAPAFSVTFHKTKIRNITDSTDVAFGTSEFSGATNPTQSSSSGSCVVTIAGSKAFALQHQCGATVAANGQGVGDGMGLEVFSRLEITKLG